MGLFSRWTKKEGSATEAPTEAPKTEAKEEKSAAETGRERVAKMREGISDAWKNFGPKATEGAKWFGKKIIELGLGAIGSAEKGVKKAGSSIEAGKSATKQYASETRQEAGELATSFGSWAEGAATELGQGLEEAIDGLNTWAQEQVDRYNEIKNAAKSDLEKGDMQLNSWADEKVEQYNQFKTNVENAPGDIKKAWEDLKAEVAAGISERFTLLREGAKKDYARAREAAGKHVDTFRSWFNQVRKELFGTAKLEGKIENLEAEIARQNRLIDHLATLQRVTIETGVGEEEDEGVVEYTSREAGA